MGVVYMNMVLKPFRNKIMKMIELRDYVFVGMGLIVALMMFAFGSIAVCNTMNLFKTDNRFSEVVHIQSHDIVDHSARYEYRNSEPYLIPEDKRYILGTDKGEFRVDENSWHMFRIGDHVKITFHMEGDMEVIDGVIHIL